MNQLSERQALQQIPKRLAAVTGLKVHAQAKPSKPSRADLVVAAGAHKFVVEYKSRANAADILAVIRVVQAQALALGKKVIPLVAVPYMGEVGRQLCAEAGVNWLDFSGNAHLEKDGSKRC